MKGLTIPNQSKSVDDVRSHDDGESKYDNINGRWFGYNCCRKGQLRLWSFTTVKCSMQQLTIL